MRFKIFEFVLALSFVPAVAVAQERLSITHVTPASGPVSGGTPVIITGTGFDGSCPILCTGSVLFGETPANYTILNSTTIATVTPPHSAGRVDVVRIQFSGIETLGGGFTYVEGTPLRLQRGRFTVEVSAVNRRDGRVSRGVPLPMNEKFGFFSFPDLTGDTENPEVFVKIVGPVPGAAYLLFYGGLTDFEYTLTVADTHAGVTKSYVKPAGEFRGDVLGATH